MHFRRSFLYLLVLVLFVPALARAASDPGERYLRLIEGDVQMQGEDSTEWIPAAANTPLLEGDKLWVPEDGKADVRFRDGMSVRLGALTAIEIGPTDDGNHEFYIDQGTMYVNHTVPRTSPVIVYAPDSLLRADGEAIFDVHVPEDGDMEVSVFRGSVYASADSGEMRIDAGNRLILRGQGNNPVLTALRPESEWTRWNRQRDHEAYGVAQPAASQYLPEELSAYGSDLDRNGRWVYAPDYGYVWTPTVIVAADWSPYRVGRWVWIRGDYVWVSYEPWGWVPYHYGRWAHLPRVGWCWVPPVRGAAYWAPAYVGWVHTPTYVAWVPLAPREVYYGRGYFGPHSFDVTRGNIGTSRPRYTNIHVTNAVTTVTTNVFLSGRPAQSRVRENPFLKERPSFGSPRIAPVRASIMPVIKDIPQAKRPPERFRDVHRASDERRQTGWRGQGVQEPGQRDVRGRAPEQNAPPAQRQPENRAGQPGYAGQRPDTDRRRAPGQTGSRPEGQVGEPGRMTGPAPAAMPGPGAVKPGDRDFEQRRPRPDRDRPAMEPRGGTRAGRIPAPPAGTDGNQPVEPGLSGNERAREQATRRGGPLTRPRDGVRENAPGSGDRPVTREDNSLTPDSGRPSHVPDRMPPRQAVQPPAPQPRPIQVSPPNQGGANDAPGPARNNGDRSREGRGPERGEGAAPPQKRTERAVVQHEQQQRAVPAQVAAPPSRPEPPAVERNQQPRAVERQQQQPRAAEQPPAASLGPARGQGRNQQEQERQRPTNRQDPQKGREGKQEQREESVQQTPAGGREPAEGRAGGPGDWRNSPRGGEQPGRQQMR